MRYAEQIIDHLQKALSLLKEQSGWDEETETLQELLEQIMEIANEDHMDSQDYLRASPTEQARELQEGY